MISQKYIRGLVEQKIADMPYFLVDVNVSSANSIRVEIDGDEGVNIADCVQISRHIEGSLDREDQDFELTVSSAGMDQPFKILRQYQRYMNRDVTVKTNSGEKIVGKLIAADENEAVIETSRKERLEGRKKKELIIENKTIPMTEIKETKVVISFK
jgi:ribosome maturation factor RimP